MNLIAAVASFSGVPVLWVIVQFVIAALIYYVLVWGLAEMHLKDPFNTILRVLLILAVCFFLINALLTLGGHPIW